MKTCQNCANYWESMDRTVEWCNKRTLENCEYIKARLRDNRKCKYHIPMPEHTPRPPILKEHTIKITDYHCSNCDTELFESCNFCFECGARQDLETGSKKQFDNDG